MKIIPDALPLVLIATFCIKASWGEEDPAFGSMSNPIVDMMSLDGSMSFMKGDAVGGLRMKGTKSSKGKKCLKAEMGPSNAVSGIYTFPDVEGSDKVCFDSSTDTWGELAIDVKHLRPSVTGDITGGGVHVHSGTDCANATAQGPHFWKASLSGIKGDGDPWYPESTSIAPTGTWYNTNSKGKAKRKFRFDQGYGYDLTVGHALVIHDANITYAGGYKRVACGILVEA